MATTIASLHFIAVVLVALFTQRRALTWVAFVIVMCIAFASGNSAYSFMDAISTLLGLGVGLGMIKPKVKATALTSAPIARPSTQAPPHPSVGYGPAREFKLHPKPHKSGWIGRSLFAALVAAVGVYVSSLFIAGKGP